ncbi:MAG TPA: PIN domain-containing protein [bacterium]|nr:PIN domain-containing protein [bacterium]
MHTTKVSSKGWVVISKNLKEKYGLKKGTRVRVVDNDNLLVLVPLPDDPVEALHGMLELGPSLTADRLIERASERAGEAGSEEVSRLQRKAQDGQVELLMKWVNVAGVAHIVGRRWGKKRLNQVFATLKAAKIENVTVEGELALAAPHIKAEHPIAFADASVAALAVSVEANLVTGDPEFKVLDDTVSIHWLM